MNFTALELAVLAGYLPVRVERSGVREHRQSKVIELGPFASDDELATIACRAFVRRKGRFDEHRVRRVVEHHGFRYAPLGCDVPAAAE